MPLIFNSLKNFRFEFVYVTKEKCYIILFINIKISR